MLDVNWSYSKLNLYPGWKTVFVTAFKLLRETGGA